MARNVEIKARVDDMERTLRLVADAADRGPELLEQVDTFFEVDAGRLKLRDFCDGTAELIYYHRPDQLGPKESSYQRGPVSNPKAMRDLLANTLGIVGCVRKRRTVFWVGRTRVHLDEVQELGNFVELEVVLGKHEATVGGVEDAERLMSQLCIPKRSLIAGAYFDLLSDVPAEGE